MVWESGRQMQLQPGDSVVGSTSAIPNKKAAFDSHYNQASATKNDGGQQIKKSPPSAHKGCSFCILDIEKAPIPELPSNEEAVGVITTEDVIKELLQEEILDGTDEYVKIHNRGSDQVSFLLFASVASTYEICEAME